MQPILSDMDYEWVPSLSTESTNRSSAGYARHPKMSSHWTVPEGKHIHVSQASVQGQDPAAWVFVQGRAHVVEMQHRMVEGSPDWVLPLLWSRMLGRPYWLSQSSVTMHLCTRFHRMMNHWYRQSGQQVFGAPLGFCILFPGNLHSESPAQCPISPHLYKTLRFLLQLWQTIGIAPLFEAQLATGKFTLLLALQTFALSFGLAKGGPCGKLKLDSVPKLSFITVIWKSIIEYICRVLPHSRPGTHTTLGLPGRGKPCGRFDWNYIPSQIEKMRVSPFEMVSHIFPVVNTPYRSMIGTLHGDECHCSGQSKPEQCPQSYCQFGMPSLGGSPAEKSLRAQASTQSEMTLKLPY